MAIDLIHEPAEPATVLPPRGIAHQEIDHRVANSLQLVAALLSVQARHAKDGSVREALDAAVHRIGAVGALHKQLCHSGSSHFVDIARYVFDLAETIEESFGGGIGRRHISAHVQARMVSPTFAGMLGILITELVINACKHAYAPDEPGDVEISLFFPARSEFRMEVRDYGGKPGHGDFASATGLGSNIIDAMCRKLEATYRHIADNEGTRFLTRGLVL